MYDTLATALEKAADDNAVRTVLIQGDPTIFSAGNDIADFMAAAAAPAQQTEADSPAIRFLRVIAAFPKPLVASVCGPAVGIGTTLLFHCDLVYAGDNAAFSLPFVNLGLVPEAASSMLVPQMFGYHRAAEALLLGEPFMAEAALEVGLVNRVVPPMECNGIAQSQARKLAAKPLTALVETKRLLKLSQQAAVQERIGVEGKSFATAMRSPAAKEAFTAFMEKRKPDFSNV
jgi:enoyl-CoA hydratase/carnithine racemase